MSPLGSRLREAFVTLGLVGLSAGALVYAQPRLARVYGETKAVEDVYAIPNPEHLRVLSLGHRSALADYLFATTLVTAGQHFIARTNFTQLDAYLEAVLALEPEYHDVYMYADSLLTISTIELPAENVRIARDIQERGLALFPDDADLWMQAGQFAAYFAPMRLPKTENVAEWRKAGARMVQHACEIWPFPNQLPVACLGTVGMLNKLGETAAAIRSLERIVAITDDDGVRARAAKQLEALLGDQAREAFRQRAGELERERSRDLPIANRALYQLLGPRRDPVRCLSREPDALGNECASAFGMRARTQPE